MHVCVCAVLQRLELRGEVRQVSSLRAVHEIVGSLYSSLEEGREEEKEHNEEEREEEMEEEERRKRRDGVDITLSAAVDCVVELVEPFVASIHQQYASSEASPLPIIAALLHHSCLHPSRPHPQHPGLPSRESVSVCKSSISLCCHGNRTTHSHYSLLVLLDQPLVSHDLRKETAAADLVRATESILVSSCVGEGRGREREVIEVLVHRVEWCGATVAACSCWSGRGRSGGDRSVMRSLVSVCVCALCVEL